MFRTAVLACKPCAQETAEGGLCDGSQPGKHSNTLSKRNKKEGRSGGAQKEPISLLPGAYRPIHSRSMSKICKTQNFIVIPRHLKKQGRHKKITLPNLSIVNHYPFYKADFST